MFVLQKFGLVLGGGGSKGAYEMGVWRALREMGHSPDIVTGTSIGALNGALIAMGDYDKALAIWENLNFEAVVSNIKSEQLNTFKGAGRVLGTVAREIVSDGGMDIAPLEKLVREQIDETAVRNSDTKLGLVAVRFPSIKEEYITPDDIEEGELADFLLASSAIYPAFKRREIGERVYVDGGYRNNLPIDFAVNLGAEKVLAVDLDAIGIIPRSLHKGADVTVLRSYHSLGSFLMFEPELVKKNILLGYNDTMKLYGQKDGYAYTFEKGEGERFKNERMPALISLFDRLGVGEPGPAGGGDRLAAKRIWSLMTDSRKTGRIPANPELRLAETAAEAHLVAPEKIYTLESLDAEIKSHADSLSELDFALEKMLENPMLISENVTRFTNAEYLKIMGHILGQIKKAAETAEPQVNLKLLAGLFPREFAAAAYMYSIGL